MMSSTEIEIQVEILKKLNQIESDINEMKREMKEIKTGVQKMDNHIDFIERIYNQIKLPFHYICDLTSRQVPTLT